jgi:hypothetical protein
MKFIEDKYLQTGVLPKSYIEVFEKARVMRELTSYAIPLSGLEYSTASYILNTNSALREAKNNLKYSFQLSSLLNAIYVKTKQKCEATNRYSCQAVAKQKQEVISNKIKQLIHYQPLSTKYLYLGDKHYDRDDEHEAFHYFHLNVSDFISEGLCPYSELQYLTVEKGIEHVFIRNNSTQNAVDHLIMGDEIW